MRIFDYIVPLIITGIIIIGYKNHINIYDTFLEGALWGMKTVARIFPVILAVTVCVAMLKESGAFGFLINLISPVTEFLHIPKEVMPLVMIRPVSGGGALGVLNDILKEFNPDSLIGITASVIMGSTETTFYTLAVYFRNTRVKYTKRIIPAAVFGDIVGVMAGVLASMIIF